MNDAMEAMANNMLLRMRLLRAVLGKPIGEATKREIQDGNDAVQRVVQCLLAHAADPSRDGGR